MKKLGRRSEACSWPSRFRRSPPHLAEWDLELGEDGRSLTYEFDATAERTGIPSLLAAMRDSGIAFKDLDTRQSSLEDIFVGLIHEAAQVGAPHELARGLAIYKFE
jgi:ABC-2 type transport system ATP-binding protein